MPFVYFSEILALLATIPLRYVRHQDFLVPTFSEEHVFKYLDTCDYNLAEIQGPGPTTPHFSPSRSVFSLGTF